MHHVPIQIPLHACGCGVSIVVAFPLLRIENLRWMGRRLLLDRRRTMELEYWSFFRNWACTLYIIFTSTQATLRRPKLLKLTWNMYNSHLNPRWSPERKGNSGNRRRSLVAWFSPPRTCSRKKKRRLAIPNVFIASSSVVEARSAIPSPYHNISETIMHVCKINPVRCKNNVRTLRRGC